MVFESFMIENAVKKDQEIARLREQRDELLAALKFYGDPKNWRPVTVKDRAQMTVDDLELTDPHEDYHCRRGGARARAAIAKAEGK